MAIRRTSHSPSVGRASGIGGVEPPGFDRTLTKRTTSEDAGSPAKGFSFSSASRSRPSHSATSALNGSLRMSSARNFVRDPGRRATSVPAAPMFTTSKPASSVARRPGRNCLCPPTLTPRRNTTSAIGQQILPARTGARGKNGYVRSHIHFGGGEGGVFLDELETELGLLAHQAFDQRCGLGGFFVCHVDAFQDAPRAVHRGGLELRRHHFAQALEAGDFHFCTD